MIIFELGCAHGHRFEGWFASGEEFARQQERSLVTCPICDDAHIERVPSARVSVAKGAARDNAPPAEPSEERGPPTEAALGLPSEAIAKLREIVRNTENVGRRFPEEARKIHYQEVAPRAIRGQASRDEAKALTDEGIEFASLPPFLSGETH
jgi:hypothetical protein